MTIQWLWSERGQSDISHKNVNYAENDEIECGHQIVNIMQEMTDFELTQCISDAYRHHLFGIPNKAAKS